MKGEWKKASEEMKALIEAAMAGVDCVKRPMFGYPAFFINGNMFSGLFRDFFFLRLPEDQKASLERLYGELPALAPMPGRPMKDYVVLPEKLVRDGKRLGAVITAAAEWAGTLPAKKPKNGKPKKK
jgi:TfoX/Sxy family transcriptional regulator of competence genes